VLHYALIFLLIAAVAAVLGFGGLAAGAAGFAKALAVFFLILTAVELVRRRKRG
jgi:uncharacterized membrane protein YtjA (UPF0391 family)